MTAKERNQYESKNPSESMSSGRNNRTTTCYHYCSNVSTELC